MNSAKKSARTDDTSFPVITGADGHKYVDPLESGGKYLVRKYDVPDVSDLPAMRNLIKDFEQRFLHFVDRGYNVTKTSPEKLDRYIEDERDLLQEIANQRKSSNNPAFEKDTEEQTKRWLGTALIGRSMRLMRHYLKQKEVGADNAKLEDIFQRVKSDMQEFNQLDVSLRGKRGYLDDDTAIKEMIGEPQKLFIACVLGQDQPIKDFYDGRYLKIANAMRTIDEAQNAVAGVLTMDRKIQATFKGMAEAAKHKIQIQHGDKDYPELDKRYMALRDDAQALIGKQINELAVAFDKVGTRLKPAREAAAKKVANEVHALTCMKHATDIIYDIAVTRNPRDIGVKQLNLEIAVADLSKPAHLAR